MEEVMSKGLTKAIGISNFTITKTENLLKTAKTIPAVNQGEGVEGDGTLDLYLSPLPLPTPSFLLPFFSSYSQWSVIRTSSNRS